MQNQNAKVKICILILVALVFIFSPKPTFAQTLSFDPTQQGVVVGQQFTVKININTGGQQTSGADALITYDPNILSVVSASNGGFYTNFANNPLSSVNNKYLISGFETDSTSLKSGTGTLATVTFSGKANGTSVVSFDCTTGSKSDSNIIAANTANDIINCSSLAQASFTVGPANATPVTSGTSGNNPTPAVLPRSGSVEVTIAAVGVGLVLTVLGLIFRP